MRKHQRPVRSSTPYLALLLWSLLLPFGFVTGSAEAAEPVEVRLVRAFTTAWNARDHEGVVAVLSTGAQIRQRQPRVVQHGANVDVHDVYGVSISYEGEPPRVEGDDVLWATGSTEVRAWMQSLPPIRQPVETTNYRVSGTTVAWDYRVPVPAPVLRTVPGLPALSGTVEAQVSTDKITQLVFSSAAGVVVRREQALAGAVATASADAMAAEAGRDRRVSEGTPSTQDRATPVPTLWLATGLLMLGGAAGLAMVKQPSKEW